MKKISYEPTEAEAGAIADLMRLHILPKEECSTRAELMNEIMHDDGPMRDTTVLLFRFLKENLPHGNASVGLSGPVPDHEIYSPARLQDALRDLGSSIDRSPFPRAGVSGKGLA